MEDRLKVGDAVHYTLFGGEQGISTVTYIEICRRGEKYGRAVKSCHINKHHGVVNLNNGHWCYFDQINKIIKQNEGN